MSTGGSHRSVASLQQPNAFLQEDAETDRGDKRHVPRPGAEVSKDDPVACETGGGPDEHRQRQDGQQRRRRRGRPERDAGDHGDDRADHRELPEGQVDLADDRIDERVPGGEEAVNAGQRDGVDKLLQHVEQRQCRLRHVFRGGWHHGEKFSRQRQPAPEPEELHRRKRPATVDRDGDEVEPAGLKGAAGEAAGDAAHGPTAGAPTKRHRILAIRHLLTLEDGNTRRIVLERADHRLAELHLLGVGTAGGEQEQQKEKIASHGRGRSPPDGSALLLPLRRPLGAIGPPLARLGRRP